MYFEYNSSLILKKMNLNKKVNDKEASFVVALDGPAGAGKGLIGRMLAQKYNLKYFESGIVYRGLACVCTEDEINIKNHSEVLNVVKNSDIMSRVQGKDLNLEQIAVIASEISAISEVRDALSSYLKNIIKTEKRVIMEGRDIGTVIAPNSDLKLFITADVEIRAERRYKQLHLEGKECMMPEVLRMLKERDLKDISRSTAPLVAADDAFVIDTSHLAAEEVLSKIESIIIESS